MCGQSCVDDVLMAVCPLCQSASCAQFPGVRFVVLHDVCVLCRLPGGVDIDDVVIWKPLILGLAVWVHPSEIGRMEGCLVVVNHV